MLLQSQKQYKIKLALEKSQFMIKQWYRFNLFYGWENKRSA